MASILVAAAKFVKPHSVSLSVIVTRIALTTRNVWITFVAQFVPTTMLAHLDSYVKLASVHQVAVRTMSVQPVIFVSTGNASMLVTILHLVALEPFALQLTIKLNVLVQLDTQETQELNVRIWSVLLIWIVKTMKYVKTTNVNTAVALIPLAHRIKVVSVFNVLILVCLLMFVVRMQSVKLSTINPIALVQQITMETLLFVAYFNLKKNILAIPTKIVHQTVLVCIIDALETTSVTKIRIALLDTSVFKANVSMVVVVIMIVHLI